MANLDNYLDCSSYASAPAHEDHPGFTQWSEGENGPWYFGVVTNKGNVVLRSEGYTTEAARNNGIESVIKNRDIEERYSVVPDEATNAWYVVLKAGNHQEIARSCPYESEEAAIDGVKRCFSTYTERAVGIIDNYLDCEAYAMAPGHEEHSGFTQWSEGENGPWYFGVVTNMGNVVLRSEAYTTEAARDNGIESVIKNRDLEARYSVVADDSAGVWYVILKAGNHQEIARSCPYESEEAAIDGVKRCFSTYTERATGITDNYLDCQAYADAPEHESYPGYAHFSESDSGPWYFAVTTNRGRIVLRSEAYTSAAARDKGIESVIKNRDLEERYKVIQDETDGKWYVILKAGNHQEIARSCPYDDEAAAIAGQTMCYSTYREGTGSTGVNDDYLPCEHYAAAPKSEKYPGFNTWYDEESASYYFAAVTGKGRVTLRSEAYTTEAARDNGIESVMKNRDLEERYKVIQDENDGKWYVILKAGNHQEIARSCAYDSEAAALAGIKSSMSTYKESAIIEDYLPCEAYHGKEAASQEGFTQFQDPDTGLHYFAFVDKSGKVILKSEGYKSAASRDNGIESVIKNRDIEERWSQQHDDEGYYMSLRAGNNQEIARTCHFSSEGALMGWWLPFAAAAFAPAVAAAETIIPPVAPVLPPDPVVVKPTPPPPPMVTNMDAAPAAAGSSWWKWLLPLLLLAALLLLWRQCGGCNKKEVEAPKAAVTTPVTPAPAPAETKPVTPPPPSCNCSAQTDPVFRVNTSVDPKKLSRLGTNPEFGNSHGLSGAEFYQKLAKQYKDNKTDKLFLDRMFKAMGYTDFSEAKADQFSEVILPVGTSGNLGYGKKHGTGYYTLPDSEQDRKAFKIKSANGCDLHFMKTCGNHFFFCPN